MRKPISGRIKKSDKSFRVERPVQTGFSSPATHYNEPRIDLNEVLVKNPSATFFVRVVDDRFYGFDIQSGDVLIVDKSLSPEPDQLVLANIDDSFSILRIGDALESPIDVWGVITYIIKSVL